MDETCEGVLREKQAQAGAVRFRMICSRICGPDDYVIMPDGLAKGDRIKITGISWGTDESMSNSYQIAMDSEPLNLR